MTFGEKMQSISPILALLVLSALIYGPSYSIWKSWDDVPGLLPIYQAAKSMPELSYSRERTVPMDVAKVFGRAHGACQDASTEMIYTVARASIDAGLGREASSISHQRRVELR